jgi:hypothetical protein
MIISPKRQLQALTVGAVFSLVASVYAVEKDAAALEVAQGDYDLTVFTGSRSNVRGESRGRLLLEGVVAARQVLGTPCRLRGWTTVDFRALGAPIGKSDTPPDSQDPDNPGVLLWEPPPTFANLMKSMKDRKMPEQPPGAPVLLIGTVENRKATRGMQDGGGIGLFVQSKEGRCLLGRWVPFGLVKGPEGQFRMCRSSGRPPNPALNPRGLRPAG